MAFGNPVTDFNQIAIGANGYLIRINTTQLLAEEVKMLQIQSGTSELPTPFSAEETPVQVKSYPESDGEVPNASFNFSGMECLVFLKSSKYPYTATTRLALDGYRTVQTVTDEDDLLDVPNKDIPLLTALVLKRMYAISGGGIPQGVEEEIDKQFKEIDDEV
jgi:hypothetical protein